MNAQAPRPVRAGHRAWLVSPLVTLAIVLVSAATLAACSGLPGGSSTAASHACADKVAQAAISGSVPGLWNCLAPDFQSRLHTYGLDGDGAIVKKPFASAVAFVGTSAAAAYYEITLTPSEASSQGFHELALVVWLNKAGKVTGLATGNSPT